MRIGEQIKNYRKTAGLTQEQVANYLGVSTPAVNKWEKGNTYPDISLLPALARLLKIDMNELFSFREELTEKEIGQFVNELSEVSLDSFTEAFEMASRKIQEYPHCDLLIYTIATVLNGSLTLSDLNDEERMEYNTAIIEWLERTADSQDERVRNSSVFILATKYVQNSFVRFPEKTLGNCSKFKIYSCVNSRKITLQYSSNSSRWRIFIFIRQQLPFG